MADHFPTATATPSARVIAVLDRLAGTWGPGRDTDLAAPWDAARACIGQGASFSQDLPIAFGPGHDQLRQASRLCIHLFGLDYRWTYGGPGVVVTLAGPLHAVLGAAALHRSLTAAVRAHLPEDYRPSEAETLAGTGPDREAAAWIQALVQDSGVDLPPRYPVLPSLNREAHDLLERL